jgi:hypothetical protein
VVPKDPEIPGDDKELVYTPWPVVAESPVTVSPDISAEEDTDPELVSEELTDNVKPETVPLEFVTKGPNEPVEDTEEAVYMLPEVGTAVPVEETPDMTDDCKELTLIPPVVVTEETEELTEDTAEPEFVPPKVVPEGPTDDEDKEAVNVPTLVVPVAPLMVPPDTLPDDNDVPLFVPEELSNNVEPFMVPPEFDTEDPDAEEAVKVPPDVVIKGPVVESPDRTDDPPEVVIIAPNELKEDIVDMEIVEPKVVLE